MNIEELKNKVYGMSQYVNRGSLYRDMKEDIDWLIAEVASYQKQLQSEYDKREALESENEVLKKEAHDKHWTLANACRNLLPYAETNFEQVKRAARELKQLRAEVARTCTWTETIEGAYNAECGGMFQFTDGGTKENKAMYCQYCGGKIKEVPYD